MRTLKSWGVLCALPLACSVQPALAGSRPTTPKPIQILGRPRWVPSLGRQALAFSVDDTLIFAAGAHGVSSMRVADGEIRRIYTSKTRMTALLPLADGKHLLLGDEKGALIEVDMTSGEIIRRIHWGTGTVTGIAVSPDGSRLAIARNVSLTGRLQLAAYDADSPEIDQELVEFKITGPGLPSTDQPWLHLRFNGSKLIVVESEYSEGMIYRSDNGKRVDLATVSGKMEFSWMHEGLIRSRKVEYVDGKPKIILVENGRESVIPLADNQAQVNFSKLSPNGELLISDGGVYVLSTRQWRKFVYPLEIRNAAFSGNGRWLAASNNGGVALIELMNGKERRWQATLNGRGGGILAFSPDGRFLASTDMSRRLILWRLADGQPTMDIEIDAPGSFNPSFAFLSDDRLAYGSAPHTVSVVAYAGKRKPPPISNFTIPEGSIQLLASQDRRSLLVVSSDFQAGQSHYLLAEGPQLDSISKWDNEHSKTEGFGRPIGFANNRLILGMGRGFQILDVRTGNMLKSVKGDVPSNSIYFGQHFTTDGRLLTTQPEPGSLTRDEETGQERGMLRLTQHDFPNFKRPRNELIKGISPYASLFSPDGELVLSPQELQIDIYGRKSGRVTHWLKLRNIVKAAAISEDNRRLAILFGDGHIEIFDMNALITIQP